MRVLRGRWGLVSILAGLFAVGSSFGALILLPARADFELRTVRGNLSLCGEGFCVDDVPLYFGPDWYLRDTPSPVDYNQDGTIGSLFEELTGLVGGQVLAEVSSDGSSNSVYALNGSPWRGIAKEAPWTTSTTPPSANPAATEPTDDGDPLPGPLLEGELQGCGSTWCLSGQALYLGPWWYLHHGTSASDFDGDGTVESPADELDGLVGTTITVEGRINDGDYEVLTINGAPWRPPDGPPPWRGGPTPFDPGVGDDPPDEGTAEEDQPSSDPVPPSTDEGESPEDAGDTEGPPPTLPEPADHDQPPVPDGPGPPAHVPAPAQP